MGVLLAPYNNAMRLGQGFNSYTQQLCLSGAVLPASKESKPQIKAAEPETPQPGRGVSQIVSYSSRFVEKLSDLTDAMNISASLSIRTATIGGKASGSFVDSDKFKESDLNFFVQVKVVNQTVIGDDYTEFDDLKTVPVQAFNEIYGDTFISGFEEGGELNALISVKVADKNKTFAVKAELEASLGTPALSGEVTGGIDMTKSEMKSSTETTVTVNWSGGGQIKGTDAIWDVNSLTLAAANFPDLVAKTPQRTHAILTKYSTLKTFLQARPVLSTLQYEVAGVYTSFLLDLYMDYKSIWKQIQMANFELKNRRADIRAAKPSQEVLDMGKLRRTEMEKKAKQTNKGVRETSPSTLALKSPDTNTTTGADKLAELGEETMSDQASDGGDISSPNEPINGTQDAKAASSQTQIKDQPIVLPNEHPEVPDVIDFEPYPPSVLGIDKARRDCRNEMTKIVIEVDALTRNPLLALDPTRESRFVSPRVFMQLLPLVYLRPVETSDSNSNANPKNLLILGETDEAPKLLQWLYNRAQSVAPEPYPAMTASLELHKAKSKNFDMGDTWSGTAEPPKTAIFFNDLDQVDNVMEPITLSIWVKKEFIVGVCTTFVSGKIISHGDVDGEASTTIDLEKEGAQSIIQLVLEAAETSNTTARVRSIQVMFDTCKTLEHPAIGRAVSGHSITTKVTLSQPTSGVWSFRGFWGSIAPPRGGFLALGAVWGQVDPSQKRAITPAGVSTAATPAASAASPADYQMFVGRTVPAAAIRTANDNREKAGMFSMSSYIGEIPAPSGNIEYFNDLERLQQGAKIKSIVFTHANACLAGYRIIYDNAPQIERGQQSKTGSVIELPASADFSCTMVELSLSQCQKSKTTGVGRVVLKDFNQGAHVFRAEGYKVLDRTTFVRPEDGWYLSGFWGHFDKENGTICQLGVVWGKENSA